VCIQYVPTVCTELCLIIRKAEAALLFMVWILFQNATFEDLLLIHLENYQTI